MTRWSIASVRRGRKLLLCLCLAAGSPAAGDTAFVTCQNGEVLSILDIDSGEERARWLVPGKPAGVSVAPDGSVFTVSPDSKTIRKFSPDGALLGKIVLDGGPIGVAHDAVRGRLFVSDWYNSRIWVLNDETLDIQTELVTGAAPAGLALSDDGQFLASADRDADQVTVFLADTLTLHARVTVGIRPFGLRYAPDGRLFVGNVGSNDVSVIATDGSDVIETVPVGARPYGVAFAQGRAFVTNQYEDSVSVIDLSSLATIGKVSVGEYPEGIDNTSDGRRIVVANWFENTVTVIDAATLDVVNEIETGDGPRAFGEFVLGGKE
ncbi:beta-propeller fold lactonase family protein [Roseovarius aestuariivivens]|uniref:YVTN family beta-propeller repeat protein n=1 Tax=Roseovarius aestuariivivens TaxID=1888910 RepID=UPI001FD8FC76|nr:beta-propeller fold lactonase family protein [Roseovarius aestuariivivens]